AVHQLGQHGLDRAVAAIDRKQVDAACRQITKRLRQIGDIVEQRRNDLRPLGENGGDTSQTMPIAAAATIDQQAEHRRLVKPPYRHSCRRASVPAIAAKATTGPQAARTGGSSPASPSASTNPSRVKKRKPITIPTATIGATPARCRSP